MDRRQSNRQKRNAAAARVRMLIEECAVAGRSLPHKAGALWHAEIKRRAGLSNSQINDNPAIEEMLREHAAEHNLLFSRRGAVAPEEESEAQPAEKVPEMVPAARLRDALQRLALAECKCAELRAENASLRAKIMQADEVAELVKLGGRISPGPP
jgi:hypothetical protein